MSPSLSSCFSSSHFGGGDTLLPEEELMDQDDDDPSSQSQQEQQQQSSSALQLASMISGDMIRYLQQFSEQQQHRHHSSGHDQTATGYCNQKTEEGEVEDEEEENDHEAPLPTIPQNYQQEELNPAYYPFPITASPRFDGDGEVRAAGDSGRQQLVPIIGSISPQFDPAAKREAQGFDAAASPTEGLYSCVPGHDVGHGTQPPCKYSSYYWPSASGGYNRDASNNSDDAGAVANSAAAAGAGLIFEW